MRRHLLIVLRLLFGMSLGASMQVNATTVDAGAFSFRLNNNFPALATEAVVTEWLNPAGCTNGCVIEIPRSISVNGSRIVVVAIAEEAFRYQPISVVTIPSGIVDIGRAAFANNDLTTVTIPDSVTSLGVGAFAANDLESLQLGTGITSISRDAFSGNSIQNLVVPDGVVSIGFGAFRSNPLTSLFIPQSVTKIDSEAFRGHHLTSITIPASVTEIGSDAFASGDFLRFVYIYGDFRAGIHDGAFAFAAAQGPLIVAHEYDTDPNWVGKTYRSLGGTTVMPPSRFPVLNDYFVAGESAGRQTCVDDPALCGIVVDECEATIATSLLLVPIKETCP